MTECTQKAIVWLIDGRWQIYSCALDPCKYTLVIPGGSRRSDMPSIIKCVSTPNTPSGKIPASARAHPVGQTHLFFLGCKPARSCGLHVQFALGRFSPPSSRPRSSCMPARKRPLLSRACGTGPDMLTLAKAHRHPVGPWVSRHRCCSHVGSDQPNISCDASR